MNNASRWIYAVTFILTALGFLLPFWPLSLLGVALAALSGRWIFATIMALLVDIAWGRPTGLWALLFFPLTFCTLLLVVGRAFGERYLLDRKPPGHL